MDARKWTAKWRILNISDISFSFSSIEGRKQRSRQNICAVYGDIGESTARKWFSRFKEDRFNISDTPRRGRPSGFDEDRLNTLIHNDPRQCTRELADVMNCDHSTIVRHLHSMGKIQKSGVQVPHALSQNLTNQRVAICASPLARHRTIDHSYPVSLLVTRNGVFILIQYKEKKGMVEPEQEKNLSEMIQFLHLALHFLESMAPLTIFK